MRLETSVNGFEGQRDAALAVGMNEQTGGLTIRGFFMVIIVCFH
jgi:hypothetical protein